MRDEWGSAWNLPKEIEDHIDIGNDDDPDDRMWLGKDNSYFAQTKGGAARRNFKGNYGSLNKAIKYNTAGVRYLGLNLEDYGSYFVLFKDHSILVKAHGLSSDKLKKWVQRFEMLK